MIEFLILSGIAFVCYAISASKKPSSTIEKDESQKETSDKPIETPEKPIATPQSQVAPQSVESLSLGTDFDIYDLINAGKDKDI